MPVKDVKFYLRQIELADKEEKRWRERALNVVRTYRDEWWWRATGTETHSLTAGGRNASRFNILWSNTQTQLPALYSATPKPDVRRRYKSEDPVGKQISQILDRALQYSLDSGSSYDFDRVAEKLVLDFLLPGRMVARVRYHPFFKERERDVISLEPFEGAEEQEDGTFLFKEKYDELVTEETRAYHVPWDKYRQAPADCWDDVWWVAYGDNFLTKEEIIDQFGEEHSEVPLLFEDQDDDKDDRKDNREGDGIKRAQVWELWDREEKKVVAVVKGYDKFLIKEDDPLKLRNFYPQPEPAMMIETPDSMIPIPEYTMYQFQAIELNVVSERISKLADAMRAKGFYPGSEIDKINEMARSDENMLVPVEDWAAHAEKGGVRGLIDWMPIKDIADVWQRLIVQRDQIIQVIFQLIGISDIQRGSSDPRETKGAQQLKANFGSRRMLPKKQRIERFFRDILRIKAEIIAENFNPETLSRITATQVTKEVVQVMRDDALRSFTIDIETDSTVAPDDQQEKQGVAEFLTAMSNYLGQVTPIVTAQPSAAAPLGKIMLWMTRKFKIARDVESEIEGFIEQMSNMPKARDGQAEAQMAEMQKKLELMAQESQTKAQLAQQEKQAKLAIEQQESQADIAREDRESRAEIARKNRESQAMIQRNQLELNFKEGKANLDNKIKRDKARADLGESTMFEGEEIIKTLRLVRENGKVVGAEMRERLSA